MRVRRAIASRQTFQSRGQTPPSMTTANAKVNERTVRPQTFMAYLEGEATGGFWEA